MIANRTSEYKVLEKEIIEIGERSRERYREIFLRGVDHPEIISALENVLSYWKDNIRPSLIQFSFEAVGGKDYDIDSIASFFSISGAGVGIHDDIIDITVQKRDRTTIPGIYGPDFALTIGDLLIVKGLTAISEVLNENYPREIVVKILEAYEGFFIEMCVGEVMEIRARKNLNLSLQTYHIMLRKLGVDTEACTKIGAIIGNGTTQEITLLAQYGRNIGYLNRLHDELTDILDIENKLMSRIQYESIPLPILFASKKSQKNYDLIKKIINNNIDINSLVQLLGICHKSGAFDYVKLISDRNMANTISILDRLEHNIPREKLELISWKLNHEIQHLFKK